MAKLGNIGQTCPQQMLLATCFLVLEQLLIECRKTKTEVITLASHKGRTAIHCPIKTRLNSDQNSSQLHEAQENLRKQVTIGFTWDWFWSSDWLRKWREFFKPMTERTNAKLKQTQITFDAQVKIALPGLRNNNHSFLYEERSLDNNKMYKKKFRCPWFACPNCNQTIGVRSVRQSNIIRLKLFGIV